MGSRRRKGCSKLNVIFGASKKSWCKDLWWGEHNTRPVNQRGKHGDQLMGEANVTELQECGCEIRRLAAALLPAYCVYTLAPPYHVFIMSSAGSCDVRVICLSRPC